MAALRKISQTSKKIFTGDEVAAFFVSQTTESYDETSDSDSNDDIFYESLETIAVATVGVEGTLFKLI